MDEYRDTDLGRHLEAVGEPGHGPGYWRAVRSQAASASTRDVDLGRHLEALGEPGHGPGYWRAVRAQIAEASRPARTSGVWRRLLGGLAWRPVRLAVVAAALAAVAAAVLLAGLPHAHGPQPVSAEQVIKRMVRAYSSGRTWQTDIVIHLYGGSVTGLPLSAPNEPSLFRIIRDSGGSYRLTRYDPRDAGAFLDGRSRRRVVEVTTYDAKTGVVRRFDRAGNRLSIVTGWPLGPPDMDPKVSPSGQDVGAILRCLEAYGRAKLERTVVSGRPAWTVTFTAGDLVGLPSSGLRSAVYETAVDAKTWLPLRMRYENSGMLMGEATMVRSVLDRPLSAQAFVLRPRPGCEIVRGDRGFRRVSPAEAASMPGVRALLPGRLPRGFELRAVAVAQQAYTANHFVPGRHVFEAEYTCGFDALTVSTRTLTDRYYRMDLDPFEFSSDRGWVGLAGIRTRISSGAFEGAAARILIATRSSSPHLWAVKDGVLLTVAGGASAKELLAVAESLRDVGAASTPETP
jgi:hypothetical protein